MKPKNAPISRVTDPRLCTGCSACVFVCPEKAISMLPDSEGFLRPSIDSEKCVGCRKCVGYCPANGMRIGNASAPIFSRAAYADNMGLRMSCASGGIFSRLAEIFVANGGTACGAAFIGGEVRHVFVSEGEKLPVLRTSKYVQSKMGDTYLKAEKILSDGGNLLFSGTPCQVAGLRAFLKSKRSDTSGLFCIDLMCHGIPSPEVFRRYMHDNGWSNADYVNFRDKSSGWASYSFKISENGRILHCAHVSEEPYLRAFLTSATLRQSCFCCQYASMRRCGDLTVGDMWNVRRALPEVDSRAGVSLILANTPKGVELVQSMDGVTSFEVSNDIAAQSNRSLYAPVLETPRRRKFFSEFAFGRGPVNSLLLKYSAKKSRFRKLRKTFALFKSLFCERKLFDDLSDPSKRVAILNLSYDCHNFGAVLVAYSLQSVLIKLGYLPSIINYYPDFKISASYLRGLVAGLNIIKFKYMFLNTTRMYVSQAGLRKLNKRFKTFLFGSDQIWRYAIMGKNYPAYFGEFADDDAKLVSYAASFGKEKWDEADPGDTGKMKELMKRFSAVSVREDSGVKICSDVFEKDSVCVLDPTLLLDRWDYTGIYSLSKAVVSGNYVACSFLGADKAGDDVFSTAEAAELASKYFGGPARDITKKKIKIFGVEKPFYNGVPEWISLIANSSFVLTNSFHCMAFAIIFGREFACLDTSNRGNERMLSLLSRLGLEGRFVKNRIELESAFASKINYGEVYEKLDALKKNSIAFLTRALSKADAYK